MVREGTDLISCDEEVEELRHDALFLNTWTKGEVGEDGASGGVVCVVHFVEEGADGLG